MSRREVPFSPQMLIGISDARQDVHGSDDELPNREALVDAIESLPEPYRTVVEGLFWERLTLAELANRLLVTRAVAERLRTEALEELKNKMMEAK